MTALENTKKILTENALAENALKNKSLLNIPSSSSSIDTVKVWLNAFIPRNIPDYTIPAPPPHDGKTMIRGPVPGTTTCYLTDNRYFEPNIRAPSRMHSEIKIDVTSKIPVEVCQFHKCSKTTEINCDTGKVTCEGEGKISGRHFFSLEGTSDRQIYIRLQAGASNPCFPISHYIAKINYEGTIRIDVNSREVEYAGLIDPFPAFEMYATANDGNGVKIFQTMPEKGKTIWNLPRDANVAQNGLAKI
jgi:hypothetical protein